MDIFTDEEFLKRMEEEVASWISNNVKTSTITTDDGLTLRYYAAINPSAKAVVAVIHGMGEFFGKWHEPLYYLYNEGYSVYFLEQRGHGLSSREVLDESSVYVSDYSKYVEDYKKFYDTIICQNEPNKTKLLIAHSMGGATGALYLERYKDDFSAAVLTSPMLKLKLGMPNWKIHLLKIMVLVRHLQKNLAPGQKTFSNDPNFENSSATCYERHMYQFNMRVSDSHYRMKSTTFGWAVASVNACNKLMKHAGRVNVPFIICQAGNDALVEPGAHAEFISRAERGKLIKFPTAKHEIFNSGYDVLCKYYTEVFEFLSKECGN